jgi:transposase-like protein
MRSKKVKTAVAKAALENVGKDLETKAGPAMEQVAADNKPAAVIEPAASEPQPTVAERLATREPVTGLGTSTADIIREARGPIPPLIQAANTRKALDDALKAKIIELLAQPNANMTKIANDLGVSYGTVQSIKSKLARPTRAASVAPKAATAPKVRDQIYGNTNDPATAGSLGLRFMKGDGIQLINDRDIQLMQLELDYLRRKVAILESYTRK